MEHNDKIKKAFWITEDMDREIDMHLKLDNCSSRSEFVMNALKFYVGYLNTKNANAFLPEVFLFHGPQFNISAIAAGFQLNTGIAVIPTVANDVGIISVHGLLYCRDRIAVPYLNSLIENHVECLSECTNYFKCNFHPLHQATASLNCSHVISLQKRRSGTYRDCRKRDCRNLWSCRFGKAGHNYPRSMTFAQNTPS